jgi:hypothetical protein
MLIVYVNGQAAGIVRVDQMELLVMMIDPMGQPDW